MVYEIEIDGSRSGKVTVYAKEVLHLPDISFILGSDDDLEDEYESFVHADQNAESNELPFPRIIIDDGNVKVDWGTYRRWGYDESDVYRVLVKSKSDEFEEVRCENAEDGLINAVSKTGLCTIKVS